MQKFKFRLQSVLQWQEKVCHLEEENARLCRLAVAEGEERIAQLRADSLVAEQDVLAHQSIAAPYLIALGQYRVATVRKGRELEAARQALAAALQEQMDKLMTARRQLRRIESLRDRSLFEHNRAVDRELETLALESHLSRWVSTAGEREPAR